MSKLKKDINIDEKPTIENFFKFLEKHYGRPANFGEIHFSTYWVNGEKVTSDPIKFCRLSEEYFSNIHQVPNPVKDGNGGLKFWCLTGWIWYHNNGKSTRALELKTLNEDNEFNARFEDAWNDIIEKGDFTKYNELRTIYERSQ